MDYRAALLTKGIKPIPSYNELRSSKANAKPGDKELVPNGAVDVAIVEAPAKKVRLVA